MGLICAYDTVVSNYVLFVCSFAEDEPYGEVFRCAALVPEQLFICTGSVPTWLDSSGLPPNVELNGFVDNLSYAELGRSAACIIALTTEEDCLQCAAYEALACETPMVLSSTEALRDCFAGAAVVENNAEAIATGVRLALAH